MTPDEDPIWGVDCMARQHVREVQERRARQGRPESLQKLRAALALRLRARLDEVEEEVLATVRAVSGRTGRADPEYAAGERNAVAAALDYAIVGVEHASEERSRPIPVAVAEQARRAARSGIALDTLLRSFMAGDRRVGEFILEEGEDLPAHVVRQIMRATGERVERLVDSVSNEYAGEAERIQRSPNQRLAAWVQELLDGAKPPVVAEHDYRFSAWHLGMIALGPGVEHEAGALAARLEAKALIVPRPDNTAWIWIGRARPVSFAEIERQLAGNPGSRLRLAVGESRLGLAGWRQTHSEARAAHRVMKRRPQPLIRCGQVAPLAALLKDEVLGSALLETFLTPLGDGGGADAPLSETLRAYFSAGGNAAATAAALEVDRHTVHRRLRKAEQRLGCFLDNCRAEMEIALRLEELRKK